MSQRFIANLITRGASRKSLTSKGGNKHYYKGKGTGAMGSHTKHGSYIIDPEKIRDFVVPSLENCQFKAYVSHKTPKIINEEPLTVESFFHPPNLGPGEEIAPPPDRSTPSKENKSPTFLRLLENIAADRQQFEMHQKMTSS